MAEDTLTDAPREREPETVHVLAPVSGSDSEAHRWARQLGLRVARTENAEADGLHLVPTREGLELWAGAQRRRGVARVDFSRRNDSGPGAARQPLHRAVGQRPVSVVDATAGFGDDAIALAGFGHHVLALEQCVPVAAMLEEARQRALAHPLTAATAERLRVECTDACLALPRLDPAPDVVYLDPMYSEVGRKTSPLPRIEIQLLRRLLGTGSDPLPLFEAALASGAGRIVVKRPIQAAPLIEPRADHHEGKLARYDVYDAAGLARHPPEALTARRGPEKTP
ncbi:MAG: class I SAM-dependent methyltransferase [Myxococcota bacterium]